MMIILKDKSQWTSAETWEELSQKMSDALNVIPGVQYSFQYPVAMRFNELMTGAKQDVVCKIFGENLDTLSKYSRILGEQVSKLMELKIFMLNQLMDCHNLLLVIIVMLSLNTD